MNKAILTLISGVLFISAGAAFAAQAPVSGKSVLKLDARAALVAINQKIEVLDRQILDTKNQAAALKALPNDGLRSKQLEMLATSYEIQKADLVKERAGLEDQ